MWGVLSAVLLAFAPSYAAAAVATCAPGFNWMYNSEGEDPCYITSALFEVCVPNAGPLAPIPSTYHYGAPTIRNDCECNTVYYSLLSACALCQGADTITWSQYQAYCPRTFVQAYPSPLPAGVGVPHYAYLDVRTINSFDLSAAQGAGGSESIRLPSATATLPAASSTSPVVETSGKKVNVGAIAGGVIGGLVLLGIGVAVAVWILLRRRRASPTFLPQSPDTGPQSPAQMSYTSSLKPSQQQQPYNSFRNTFSGNQSLTQQPLFHPGSPEV